MSIEQFEGLDYMDTFDNEIGQELSDLAADIPANDIQIHNNIADELPEVDEDNFENTDFMNA